MAEYDYDNLVWIDGNQLNQSNYPSPVPQYQGSLYDEIKYRCKRENFMEPYDYDKINAAANILSDLENTGTNDKSKLNELRKRAIEQLGIKFSTEVLFNKLKRSCNPSLVGLELTEKANSFYKRILENADDIEALEQIEFEAKDAGIITSDIPPSEELDQRNFLLFLYAIYIILIIFFLIYIYI